MRRLLASLAALAATVAIVVVPASAITDGVPDGDGHPYVGLMVAFDNGTFPLWRCSGTLLSSDVFLTAGHCTEAPADRVEIWFAAGPVSTDPDYVAAVQAAGGTPVPCNASATFDGYPCKGDIGGRPQTHPQYNPNAFYLYDLGVVELDGTMPMATYGQLPSLNQLDGLKTRRGKQSTTFTAVGYGLQAAFPDAASWKTQAQRTRMVAHPELIQINGGIVGDFALLLSNNANTGGTCFGDSGGPNFIGNSNTLAGVTSFGLNQTCAGTGGVYRIDRQDDLDWLATFLP